MGTGSDFPQSGMEAVFDLGNWSVNFKVYLANLRQLDKAESDSVRKSKQAEVGGKAYANALKFAGQIARKVKGDIGGITRATDQAAASSQRASGGITNFTQRLIQLDAGIRILRTASGLLTDFADGIGQLNDRAVAFGNVQRGFANVTAEIGGQEAILASWREQSQGALDNMRLMELGNQALLGVTGDLRDTIAENYGTVIAGALSAAAAKNVDFNVTLEKFTRGIRVQSNALVDDLGVRVDAIAANERYAESHGLVASQLTDEQKAAAWAEEAFRQLNLVMSQTGGATATLQMQATAAMENALNSLAMATRGASTGISDSFASIQLSAAGLIEQSAPYLAEFAGVADQVVASIAQTVTGGLAQFDPAAFFTGGANVIVAMANGMLSGLTYVVRVLNIIAQTVADFLMGFSPPKTGPLSQIDVGGQNVVQSWVDAMTDVELGPVEDVAGRVGDIFSSIAGLDTGDKVTVLEQLQKRLQGRLESAVATLSQGGGNAAEVRALDAQRVALNEQLELLRERQALERAGLSTTQATALAQTRISKSVASTTAARATEKDEIAEIQQKIAENKKLQAEYAAQGLETNDLVSQELSLYRQLAAAQSRRGTDNTGTLAQIDALQAGMDTDSSRTGGGGSLAGLLETGEEGGLIPLDEMLAGSRSWRRRRRWRAHRGHPGWSDLAATSPLSMKLKRCKRNTGGDQPVPDDHRLPG
jgi:hypothetical protein